MKQEYKVVVETKQDQEDVATILFRAGYTVRNGREKVENKTKPCVFYWMEC